jgi:hypothetical protein
MFRLCKAGRVNVLMARPSVYDVNANGSIEGNDCLNHSNPHADIDRRGTITFKT